MYIVWRNMYSIVMQFFVFICISAPLKLRAEPSYVYYEVEVFVWEDIHGRAIGNPHLRVILRRHKMIPVEPYLTDGYASIPCITWLPTIQEKRKGWALTFIPLFFYRKLDPRKLIYRVLKIICQHQYPIFLPGIFHKPTSQFCYFFGLTLSGCFWNIPYW